MKGQEKVISFTEAKARISTAMNERQKGQEIGSATIR